jgi:hypothetical protein
LITTISVVFPTSRDSSRAALKPANPAPAITTRCSTRLVRDMPGLAAEQIRWMLLDTAPRLLPQLDERLSKTA